MSTKAQGKAACEQRRCKQTAFLLEILQPQVWLQLVERERVINNVRFLGFEGVAITA